MATVAELVAVLRADARAFNTQIDSAIAKTEELKGASTGMSKAASTAFIAAGAVAVIAIGKMVDSTVEFAREVQSLQNVTGQSAESASTLIDVAAEYGLSVQQATTAFGIFSKNIVSGNKNIEKFGLVTRDAQGNLLPFDELLGNAADTYRSLATQTQKTAFAQLVFGRSGRALMPILKQGRDNLEALKEEAGQLGPVLDEDAKNAALNLGISMRKLGEGVRGLSVSIGSEFVPIVAKMVSGLVTFLTWLNKISPAIPAVTLGIIALAGAGALLIRIGSGIVGAWAKVIGAFTGSVTAEEAQVGAMAGSTDASLALTDAVTALTASLERLVGSSAAAADAVAVDAETDTAAVGAAGELTVANEALAESETAVAGGAGAASTGIGATAAAFLAANPIILAAAAAFGEFAAAYFLLGAPSSAPNDPTKTIQGFVTAYQYAQSQVKAGDDTWRSFAEDQVNMAVAAGANADAFRLSAQEGISYADALVRIASSAKATTAASKDASLSLTAVANAMNAGPDDPSATLVEYGNSVAALNADLARHTGLMEQYANVSGQSTDTILANLSKVINDEKSTPADVAAAYVGALGEMRDAQQAWHDSIVAAFGGAGSAMDEFANVSNVSISDAIGNLRSYTAQIHSFGDDTAAIHRRFGKDANDFIQWATSQGLAQAGLVHAVATSSKKDADTFVAQWKRSQDATDTLATSIQKALGPVFERILLWLRNVVRAIQGLPPVHITADASQAISEVQRFQNALASAGISSQQLGAKYGTAGFRQKGNGGREGGLVYGGGFRHFAMGGSVAGVDTIPALLQPGEFVLRKSIVDALGPTLLHRLNRGDVKAKDLQGLHTDAYRLRQLVIASGVTKGEAQGVVQRIKNMGDSARFIAEAAAAIRNESGREAAERFRRIANRIDDRYNHSDRDGGDRRVYGELEIRDGGRGLYAVIRAVVRDELKDGRLVDAGLGRALSRQGSR